MGTGMNTGIGTDTRIGADRDTAITMQRNVTAKYYNF